MSDPAAPELPHPAHSGSGSPPSRVYAATADVSVALIALPWVMGAFGDAWVRALCFMTL